MRRVLPAVLLLAACASRGAPDDTVSVQYNAYDFEMSDLQRAAEAQCSAKGYRRAEPLSNQPNTESARWSYLTFGCYAS